MFCRLVMLDCSVQPDFFIEMARMGLDCWRVLQMCGDHIGLLVVGICGSTLGDG